MLRFISIVLLLQVKLVEPCCRSSSPDPTFIDPTEYYVDSITPNIGTIGGGARVTIKGGGFHTNFFTGGNYVYIGSDETEWVACDVFEGACTVECGGPNTLICDTGAWTYSNFRTSSGWLDVKVLIEIFADDGADEVVELLLESAYYYHEGTYEYSPMLLDVSPHAASSEDSLTLKGNNFGYWIQDYRMVYVGSGRAPQGANINNGVANTESLTTHAVCRPGDLNDVHNPNEPDLTSTTGAMVMPEDRNADPISEDILICGLGDFMAGSYNVSIYMDNNKRADGGSTSVYQPGLVGVYDFEGYYEASLFSRDALGVLHMVQYYPRIDSVYPSVGSTEGGTVVTIEGGGFAMDEDYIYVMIDNRKCIVTYASIEKIICNTTAQSNVTVPSKVLNIDHNPIVDEANKYIWMTAAQIVGNWTTVVNEPTAHNNSFLRFTGETGTGWVTFLPGEGSVNVSGHYSVFVHLPLKANTTCASTRANNVSIVIRSSSGYSLSKVDFNETTSSSGISLGTEVGGGLFIEVGNFTFLNGATAMVTVDTTGIEESCLLVDTVLMKFISPISEGCTDSSAENYDADIEVDDGSCLYLGGRGLSSASWSSMATPYKLDDWYPEEEYETWSTGEFCSSGSNFDTTTIENCWHGECKLHSQCGIGAFCCLTDNHHGCIPATNELEDVDEEGWKLIFRHDINEAGGWPKGWWVYGKHEDKNQSMYGLLGELETFRRASDGRFEFKACWPGSGFGSCQHWTQLRNPLLNPDSTNTHALCVNCPYSCDTGPDGGAEFRGLQYNGQTHLLDADSDGDFFQLGAQSSTSMYGPQLYNDEGVAEYPTVVELYIRPDLSDSPCLDCKACFDEFGEIRMTTYSPSDGGASYQAPACPNYCLDANHVNPQPREAIVRSAQQLVISSQGLTELPCVVVETHDDLEEIDDTNTTVCEGLFSTKYDAVPTILEYGKVGGIQTKAFFVASTTANYTFNTRFSDGGELWLSPNGDPRSAELLISVNAGLDEQNSKTETNYPGQTTLDPSIDLCEDWTCVDNRCFRYFTGRLNADTAQRACETFGGNLATPRNQEENDIIRSLITNTAFLGINDENKERYYYSRDGEFLGTALWTTPINWKYENFASTEPNDYRDNENCIAMYTSGLWNDVACFSTRLPFVCEMEDVCDRVQSSAPIPMQKGEVRYLEVLGYSHESSASSLLTLTIQNKDDEAFTTSEVLGLSSEFFREIKTDQPVIDVSVNDFTSACAEGGNCFFRYSDEHTPEVFSVEPEASTCGVTDITITGVGFSNHSVLNEVSIGGGPCDVSESGDTFIVCRMPATLCTAGLFIPMVNVFNKGLARNHQEHRVLMHIDSVSPSSGSLYGGLALTITGSGFARFGLHNQIKLSLKNATSTPEGTHDTYDDDWIWGRGHIGRNNTSSFEDVLCVPRVVKNRACRVSEYDSGVNCNEELAWAYDKASVTDYAEWYDFSNPTYIECIVESFEMPLLDGTLASLNVTIVNSTTMMDLDFLTESLQSAKLNNDCSELSHCMMNDVNGAALGWFGSDFTYSGFTLMSSQSFAFSHSLTPIIHYVSPTRVVPGQLISIYGQNLLSSNPVDTNWYMNEFGSYEQPKAAVITVGNYGCEIKTHNDTVIQCFVTFGHMYTKLPIAVSIYGLGNAFSNSTLMLALDVKSISPSSGSLAGGTTITIETSTLNSEVAGVGVTNYNIWFIPDESLGISQYTANRLGIDLGMTCDLVPGAKTTTSLSCVTNPMGKRARKQPFNTSESHLESWLVSTWNGNEIYSRCEDNCNFSMVATHTPVLALDSELSSLLFNQTASFDETLSVSWGDMLVLYRNLSNDIAKGVAFNWSSVDTSDISITLNNASLDFELIISDDDTNIVKLFITINDLVIPCVDEELVMIIEPFGRAVILDGGPISVLPVITSVSHGYGSMKGGLEVIIEGRALTYASSSVFVGGRPCTETEFINTTSVKCVTSSIDSDGVAYEGFGAISVITENVPSICLLPDDYVQGEYVRSGCEFQFSMNTTHTPWFDHISPAQGHYPLNVTIVGEGFGASGNKVKLGSIYADIVSENSTYIIVSIPKHVGGTYPITIHVPDRGFAGGVKQWFRFESGIDDITPKVGSMYGGQRITISGYGFAPSGEPPAMTSADETYASLFSSWVNFGTSSSAEPFDIDTIHSTFDTIVATTHFRDARLLEGDYNTDWIRAISIDVAQENVGYIAPSSYYQVAASDGDTRVRYVFDHDLETMYDGYGSDVNLGILYQAYDKFLLTDYQLIWRGVYSEGPSKWKLYGRETSKDSWELVDTMDGPRTEPANYKHINRTVDTPGYFRDYYWLFEEWAPAYGLASRSDGHQIRDINLNPNSFAMHYGRRKPSSKPIRESVALGLANVVVNKPIYQSNDYAVTWADALISNAIDGDIDGIGRIGYFGSKTCSITSSISGTNTFVVIDMEQETTVRRVMIYGILEGSYWHNLLTEDDGLLIGLSNSIHDSDDMKNVGCWGRQDCGMNTTNFTVCGILNKQNVSQQYFVDCPEGNVGRYLVLYSMNQGGSVLPLCEVVAYGYPLDSSADLSTPDLVVNSIKYKTLDVKYHTYTYGSRTATRKSDYTYRNQQLGISWDDAAEMCMSRNMQLASVKTAAEQAALVASVAEKRMYDIEYRSDDAGSEFSNVWLGGKRDIYRNWWHWRDDSNIWDSNYTNWVDGFSYSDMSYGDNLWYGSDAIGYLCMNSFTNEWDTCDAFENEVYAYVCEERSETIESSYMRTRSSPLISSIHPTSGVPGTVLTISGENFNTSLSDKNLNVTISGSTCTVSFANDSKILCTVPQLSSGVFPVRMNTWLGLAGPARLPLFKVKFDVYNVTPSLGSLGGGQEITITGENFPLDIKKTIVSLILEEEGRVLSINGTNHTRGNTTIVSCDVINSTYTQLVCLTSPIGKTLSRYNNDGSLINDDIFEGLSYQASISIKTLVGGDGDELRLVSSGTYSDYGDNQRPSIFLVSNTVGIEHTIPGSDWVVNDFNNDFAAMFYNPISREVVSFCGVQGLYLDSSDCYSAWSSTGKTPTDLVSFLRDGSSSYILIIETKGRYDHEFNEDVYSAIESCGGSSEVLEVNREYNEDRQYLLVGRCNVGYTGGESAARGLEAKHAQSYMSLEIQLDLFAHFDIELNTNHTSLSYTFDEDATPYVEWISRKNGTTAGGTTVQLVGSGFAQNSTVTLAGIPCAVRYEEIGSYRNKHLCDWDGVDCDGIGVSDDGTKITCLTNKWDYGGDAFDREVIVSVNSLGYALTADTVKWSYANLWSSTTTWGGNDPPVEGDSVVITYGEYIVLDVSPPELVLLTIQGNLEFARDVGDLALNCSYIVLHYGRLFVGTADEPFETHNAIITLVGDRNTYELPVYGAKTIAVRTAELYLHGRHRISWTKLARTAGVGNTTLVLRDDTDWEVGDHIFVSSTEHDMLQAEECYISAVSSDGRVIEITKPLIYEHWGEGWTTEDGKYSMDGYRASVGLLTRNVVVQGDHIYSKAEQFGAQIVLSTESNTEDNPLKGMFSNVEVRQAGQGLKLGKYPIHFHMVGNVSESYIKNCSVHHTFNRGITIHGVDNLLVEYNVIFDTRGHTIFTEDGTERFNTIRYNLVSVVRPIWSLLSVDQSPACFWIVNPTNDVYGNVAAGSSHYGFWYRALPQPDGVSGQATLDAGLARCPNWGELGRMEDNTAHSTGRHGLKVSNFFPVKNGYYCPTNAIPEPATFKNFTSFKNRHMGIWGEFLVDVNFDTLNLADHVKSGIEFKYINGRSAKFATTFITNALFVGNMDGKINTPEGELCQKFKICQGLEPVGDDKSGWFYRSNKDMGDGWTHAINIPGIGVEVEVHNSTFVNYQAAMYGCSWCVAHRGGYEMEFWNITMINVDHIAHFKHGLGGILVDGDGSLGTGVPGGSVVPPTGQWRTNSNCTVDPTGHFTTCGGVVRRVNLAATFTSPYYNTNLKKKYPLLTLTDLTEQDLDEGWDYWNRALDETQRSCSNKPGCGLLHYGTPNGPVACFEQAPMSRYNFLAQVGRRYLITWVDQNFLRTTADVEIAALKMRSDEVIIFQFIQRPPLYSRMAMRASVASKSVELWGELEPRLGAWSPYPNIPVYDPSLADHGGDALIDPCSSGTMATMTYPGSCDKGETGFNAVELSEDPDINLLRIENFTNFKSSQKADVVLPSTIAAQGRTNQGGLLHPKSGTVMWTDSITIEASSVHGYQYKAYCMTVVSEPDVSNSVNMALDECQPEISISRSEYVSNLQRFKFGYDWTGDWDNNIGSNEIWTNALDSESDLEVWHQPLTIVLASNPIFCLDIEDDDTYIGARVVLDVCEEDSFSQLFYFEETTNEIVSYGAQAELSLSACLGWGTSSTDSEEAHVYIDVGLYLYVCNGTYQWGEDFYMSTTTKTPIHGSFYFDPYRNFDTRGIVQPQNVHNLSTSKELYKSISSWTAGQSYYDYTVWNTSVLSLVVAGNTTLTLTTDSCPIEGCASSIDSSMTIADFKWSDNSTWDRLNTSVPCDHNPSAMFGNRMCSETFPCGCGDVTIEEGWTVTLDMITPFMNTLTIRGTLIVQHDAISALAIHANLINIKGGRLIIGNETHPFVGPQMQVFLHGDMYFHGKECTNPTDTFISEFGCWKQMIINGELSIYGKEVEVTRMLTADAPKGSNYLVLDDTVFGWESGDELVLSSSNSGGQPEYHTVDYVSEDGFTVYLTDTLSNARIGTVVTVSDSSSGLQETILDGRATVSHITRNVELRGGYDLDFDYISGVGPDITEYGATIRVRSAWSEPRDGWDITMAGYDVYGVHYYPDGFISNMQYVRFRSVGKQYSEFPPVREPPLVLASTVKEFTMVGVVVTETLTGKFFECSRVDAYQGSLEFCSTEETSKTVIDSVFVGIGFDFSPSKGKTDIVLRNVFFGGDECRTNCPSNKMVKIGGNGGRLNISHNYAYGGFGGFTLRAPCEDYDYWYANVATGNSVGFDIEIGCTSLFLEGYRNSAGITANTSEISNFLMVENGIGLTPGYWFNAPDTKEKVAEYLVGGSELGVISNGVIIGKTPEVSGSVRSANCEKWVKGGNHPWSHGYILGGILVGFRHFTEYGYTGFSAQGAYTKRRGAGYGELKTRVVDSDVVSRIGNQAVSTFQYLLKNITFYGFSGKDSCGRTNVAISNEMAGDGEGTARAYGAHLGKATCYPINVQNTSFIETPDYARLRFSKGPTTPEVTYGLCLVYDDGSIMSGSSYLDDGVGPYILKATKKHEWPVEVLRDCQNWAYSGYADDYDGAGTCLWWLRTYENLRSSITDSSLRGVAQAGIAGTQYSSAFCEEIFTADSEISNNVMFCSGMEYVQLKSFIPKELVSGSEILYGPVGYISMKDSFYGSSSFAGSDATTVDIYMDYHDPRGDQMPPQSGLETQGFWPLLDRFTQPYLATLVNHGYYRIQYTGDIGLFKSDFLEYQLVGLTDKPIIKDDFTIVVDIKFLTAVNVAFYFEGRQVAQSARRDLVSLDAKAGTNYLDPVSKVLSFVVKGTSSPVRIRQLSVVSVGFGIVSTFESFFEDNFIDPNAIDASFADLVPPTYAANYDPDNGNIVKSNTFVKNLASLLNINPARIRVVNIVPGNRRRLVELAKSNPEKYQHHLRNLADDDGGLGIDFEISSIDPCDGVTCVNGDCNKAGTCDCDDGYTGDICNTTVVSCTINCPDPTAMPSFTPSMQPTQSPSDMPTLDPTYLPVPLPSTQPTNTFAPTAGTPFPTLQPNFSPTASPSFQPSAYPTHVPTAQSVSLDNFAELISVASLLTSVASAGTLDTGYTVSEAIIALPEDECGVAGGDSTTCNDACGVINGDNSTCSDTCSVPNGDGTSCIDTSGGFYTCDHAASNGVMNERQAILIRGTNMIGLYFLTFNGESTQPMSVYSSTDVISEALNSLNSVGTVLVSSNQTTSSSGSGISAIDIYVEFTRETDVFPYHYGPQPLLQVNVSDLIGQVTYTDVSKPCEGKFRNGYTFDEQDILVTVNDDHDETNTTFKVLFNATGEYKSVYGVSSSIPITASSYQFSESFAAMTWYGLDDDVVYELDRSYFEVYVNGTAHWVIRFYFAPNSNGLRTTVLGNVPLLQDLKSSIYASDSDNLYELSVSSLLEGSVPTSVMPVSAVAAAAASGESDAEDAAVVVDSDMSVTEVIHVCGNGLRTSIEVCDDDNNDSGDGCSSNCTIETGFVCTTTIGATSVCSVPANPTIYFESTLFGPYAEGGKAYATVKRMGNNMTVVSAVYTVVGSTAVGTASSNDDCATAADFDNTGGEISFPIGVSSVDIEVDVYEDDIWEQALSTYERFVVSLVSSSDADIDSTRSTTSVRIQDMDLSNMTLGWCVTDEPTMVPTSTPSHSPSPMPSITTAVPTISTTTTSTTNTPTTHPTSEAKSPTSGPISNPTSTWYGLEVKVFTSAVLNGFSFNTDDTSIEEVFDSDQQTLFKNALVDSVALLNDVNEVNITDVSVTSRRRSMRNMLTVVDSLSIDYSMDISTETFTSDLALISQLTDELNTCFEANNVNTSIFSEALASFGTSLGVTPSYDIDASSTLDLISSALTYVVTKSNTFTPTSVPTFEVISNKNSSNNSSSIDTATLVTTLFACMFGIALIGYLGRKCFKHRYRRCKIDTDENKEKGSSTATSKRLESKDFDRNIPVVTKIGSKKEKSRNNEIELAKLGQLEQGAERKKKKLPHLANTPTTTSDRPMDVSKLDAYQL